MENVHVVVTKNENNKETTFLEDSKTVMYQRSTNLRKCMELSSIEVKH